MRKAHIVSIGRVIVKLDWSVAGCRAAIEEFLST